MYNAYILVLMMKYGFQQHFFFAGVTTANQLSAGSSLTPPNLDSCLTTSINLLFGLSLGLQHGSGNLSVFLKTSNKLNHLSPASLDLSPKHQTYTAPLVSNPSLSLHLFSVSKKHTSPTMLSVFLFIQASVTCNNPTDWICFIFSFSLNNVNCVFYYLCCESHLFYSVQFYLALSIYSQTKIVWCCFISPEFYICALFHSTL